MKHARGRDNKTTTSKRVLKEKKTAREKEVTRDKEAEILSSKGSTRAQFEEKRLNKKKKKRNKFWANVGVAAAVCICIGLVVVLGVGAGMYAAIEREMDDLDYEAIAYNYSSVVYAEDKDGNAVEVEFLHNDGNREWIETEKIPQVAKDAAVAIEDERFYSHKGVDLKRTTGAVFGWVSAKITGGSPAYGGSTITQQVIKNLTNEKDKTVTRKVKEMMRAVAFEKRFTKEEILSAYLNVIYFGNQCYGIESAAKMYYSKNAIDLTLPEAAMIVGITQAPTRFDPFKNPDNALGKRNTVLTKMYELEKITKEEYDAAIAAPLGVNKNKATIKNTIYSYFVDQVINDVIADLQEQKGYSYAFATKQVFGGGFKIYTTMDSDIQAAIEEVYKNTSNFPNASSGIQSAMVIMDPYTGQVKGMVGGIGEKTESRGLNRATQTKRQPGSSIKPLSVYGPALEKGKITAATIINDAPLTVKEKDNWTPTNSYKGFKGNLSVRKAIEISANIPAVKTLQMLGVEESYDFMTNKLGFDLASADKDLSPLSLGGLTKGVSAQEMAAAYAVFANGGNYIPPYTYTKVVDRTGKVLLENKPEPRRVMSEENAYIMTSFLKDVVNGSAGTGARARLSKMTAYGKTGTSNDNNDKWFCGYTPYYVGATWYGYDNNGSVGSSNISATVWKKVMDKVHENLEAKDFEKPEGVVALSVCQVTGKLSSSGCTHAKTEYFVKGETPTNYCNNRHGNVNSEVTGNSGTTEETNPSDGPTTSPSPETTQTPTTVPSQEPSVRPSKNPEVAPEAGGIITID